MEVIRNIQKKDRQTYTLHELRTMYYTKYFIPKTLIKDHVRFKWIEGFTAGFVAGLGIMMALRFLIL